MSLNDKQWLYEQYVVKDRSFADIAEELGTYRHKVRRAAIKLGIKPKDKSAAQAAALKSQRATHPTEATQRPLTVKQRISEAVADNWAHLDPEKLRYRASVSRHQWENMSEDERQQLLKLAGDAIRKAAKEGSKLEKFLRTELTKAGFMLEYHREGLVPNQKLQVDLFIPSLATAIEIDGPSHFLPIWGEDNLERNIRADAEKTGLLLQMGVIVIRVKQLKKSVSQKLKRDALAAVLEKLYQIKKDFPNRYHRLIEIEV